VVNNTHVAVLELHIKEVRLRLHLLLEEGASPVLSPSRTSEDALGALGRPHARPIQVWRSTSRRGMSPPPSGPPRMRYVRPRASWPHYNHITVPLGLSGGLSGRYGGDPRPPPSYARALGRPLHPMKVTITWVVATTSASGASLPTTTSTRC
jgi:hypothetical protein